MTRYEKVVLIQENMVSTLNFSKEEIELVVTYSEDLLDELVEEIQSHY